MNTYGVRKRNEWKRDFLVKSFNILMTIIYIITVYSHQSKLVFWIYFFKCTSYKCQELSRNYITCDLDDPNFGCTTIVIPLFS